MKHLKHPIQEKQQMDEAKLTLSQMTKVMRTLGPMAAQARDTELSGRNKTPTKFGQGPVPERHNQVAASTDRAAQFFQTEQRKQLDNVFLDDSNFGYGFEDDSGSIS